MSETRPQAARRAGGYPHHKPGKPAAAGGPVAYKLSSNENPYPPLPGVLESVTAAACDFNRYPDMACTGLMNELSDRFRCAALPPGHRYRLGGGRPAADPGHQRPR